MRRPWQKEGREDDAVAIGLRKEIDAWCVDARLNKGCGIWINTMTVSEESDIEKTWPA
jgi:hypothetical protein